MKFKSGQPVTFKTTDTTEGVNRYNNQIGTVNHDPLAQACFDIKEVGQMYSVTFKDGNKIDVFEDEIAVVI